MKKGLLYLIAVVALAGCSKQEGTTSSTSMTNEAAGAASSNAPAMQNPTTPPMAPGANTNMTNDATGK